MHDQRTSALAGTVDPDRLFSFGTLILDAVQAQLFGGPVPQEPAALAGHGIVDVHITDPEVVRLSGSAVHRGLKRSVDAKVPGFALTVTDAQLAAADDYEVDAYIRRRILLDDGSLAWGYLAADPLSAAERIAVVGDSIAYGLACPDGGWAASLARAHTAADPVHRFWNLAIPGERLLDASARAEAELAPRRVDTVLLAAGVNDLAAGPGQAGPAQLLAAVDSFCAAAEAAGRRPIVCTPVWADEERARTAFGMTVRAADLRGLRDLLVDWAAATHRDLVDLHPVLEDRPELFTDGIHPTAEGHRLLAEAVLGAGPAA